MLVRDVPVADRPRERLARLGVEALSDRELLAVLLRTGGAPGASVHELDCPGRQTLTTADLSTLPVELWIDGQGRPVKVSGQFSVHGQSISSRAGLSNYNAPVHSTAPPQTGSAPPERRLINGRRRRPAE